MLAFPDFEYGFLGWFAPILLIWAVEREKASAIRSFAVGWVFGTFFFFGTCWWLTFAPITYAGFPWWLAYLLFFCVTAVSGVFPAVFAAVLALLLRRFGRLAWAATPFIWTGTEFLRYWLTGNNWNAIGYSQAFTPDVLLPASIGGVYLVGFAMFAFSTFVFWSNLELIAAENKRPVYFAIAVFWGALAVLVALWGPAGKQRSVPNPTASAQIVAVQPNVPMSGLDQTKWRERRTRQIELAEAEIKKLTADRRQPTTVILPESPMNYMYNDDREFQQFIHDFARRNNVNVLFNSAEPDATNGRYFNSAVMVGPQGSEVGQYDKIYLLPFGEAVPWFLDGILPGFVGNFSYGGEYDLFPLGEARAGVMICFESHFGQLSRAYVRNGADVIIEMTNDGYLGPTPVLRQHLANAVFRAVETNRPVLRVTNVGVTAYIDGRGNIADAAPTYDEASRVWAVGRSDGSQTFYVKYGDWFAWLCSMISIGLLIFAMARRSTAPRP